jgi:hypothetical protein
MSASVQRDLNRENEMKDRAQQDIANLAYALWQRRGCPDGSPEQDWLEAEKMIETGQQK